MNKEKIANIIYNELSYMYCDNCRYATELIEDPNTDIPPCDGCNRKSNNWGISMAEAERIATLLKQSEDNAPSVVPSSTGSKRGKWVEDGCYPYCVCNKCGQMCGIQNNGWCNYGAIME